MNRTQIWGMAPVPSYILLLRVSTEFEDQSGFKPTGTSFLLPALHSLSQRAALRVRLDADTGAQTEAVLIRTPCH